MLQARINELQDKLGRGMIVDKSTLPTDRVVFGSRVSVLDLALNDEEDFILVGPGDEDYDQNKILLTSPIGQRWSARRWMRSSRSRSRRARCGSGSSRSPSSNQPTEKNLPVNEPRTESPARRSPAPPRWPAPVRAG